MSMDVRIQKQLGAFRLQVSFQTHGGILGLLGASGSGKSKTLQCITGIEKPDQGCISVNGRVFFDSEKNIDLPVQERRVGCLFQNYALFPNMTVEDNIACGVRRVCSAAQRRDIVGTMMERMRLTGLNRQKPAQLSGGQQQRVALARILVNEPDILLLDEPFSALDSYLKEQVMTELDNLLAQFRKDVVIVTHSRDEAYQLCDSIAILAQGNLEVIGEKKRIFADPQTPAAAVLTGCKNIVAARRAGPCAVYVPDWNIILDAGQPVDDAVCAIGVRAHCFHEQTKENAFPVQIVEEIEQPFEWIVKFRYAAQPRETVPVWWRFAKMIRPEAMPSRLGVKPADILLLHENTPRR